MSELRTEKIPGGCRSPVFTSARNEKKLCATLEKAGPAVYLPLRRHVNIRSVIGKGKNCRYRRTLHVPMFPGHLFANVTPGPCSEPRCNRSAIRILEIRKPQKEVLINELKLIRELEEFSEAEKIKVLEGLQRGRQVKFTGGSFAGWNGAVLSVDGKDGMVSVNISSIDISVLIKYPVVRCAICD